MPPAILLAGAGAGDNSKDRQCQKEGLGYYNVLKPCQRAECGNWSFLSKGNLKKKRREIDSKALCKVSGIEGEHTALIE